jgi:photosystem II stability/assembly factor-like uncharacterized protein
MLRPRLRLFVLASFAMFVSGCPLPTNVRYRCETDGTCALKGQVCALDGYCHPKSDLLDDGGLMLDGGPCVRRDVSQECAAAECGFLYDGCDWVDCARACPAPQECGVQRANRCALPRLCTAEGWCWENPLPQGFNLNAAWRLDARHAWFVGEARTILFWDGERSTLQHAPAPPAVELEEVNGASPTEVYAVGTQGVILHFDGTTWEREQANSQPTATLRAVYAFGDGGALVGGNGGLLLSRRAALEPTIRWAVENLGVMDDVRDIFTDADGRVLVLTRRNQLFARGANGWELTERVGILTETVAGTAWNDGLLVAGNGPGGYALAFLPRGAHDAGAWEGLDAGFAILELQPGDGGQFLIGQNGYFAWLDDDGGMLRLNSALNIPMTGIMQSGHTLLAAGQNGAMATVNLDLPTAALAVAMKSTPVVRRGSNLSALCGTAPTQLYATGQNETGAGPRWFERAESDRGVEWKMREFQLGGTQALQGCFAEGDRAWLLGDDSKFISLVGGQPTSGDFTGSFGGVYVSGWGARGVGYFFVRTNSRDLTASDSGVSQSFEALSTNAPGDLRAVWGLGGDDLVTVGLAGSVSRFDGASWTATTLGADDLFAVHGVRLGNERRYVAAGANGAVATFGATGDLVTVIDPTVDLHEAFVAPSGVAFVGGTATDGGGVLYRQGAPGAPWTAVPLVAPREVNGVFGFGEAPLWIAGPRGMILRRD